MDDRAVDRLLRHAISERRLISFLLNERRRIGEPHDYGIYKGVPRLFFYQTGGESSSGTALGWRWAEISRISQLQVLDATFAGPRIAGSGSHQQWDTLFASVAVRAGDRHRTTS
jgi:hypothetical protein